MHTNSSYRRGSTTTVAGMSLVAFTVVFTGLAALMAVRSSQPTDDPHGMRPASEDGRLVIYSGRSSALVDELIQQFRTRTGIAVEVKYAQTGPLARLILEEGRRSPADLFFAQDPGGLGLLARHGRLRTFEESLLSRVDAGYRDPNGKWIGVTGRARSLSYSQARLSAERLPRSVFDLTDPQWRGRVGWAPSNASFQAFVTAMRLEYGPERTEQWLRDMMANGVRTYPRNGPIVQAVADGEIDLGLTNHYYLHRFIAEQGSDFPVANHYLPGCDESDTCDIGSAMLVAGAGILDTTQRPQSARMFIEFLLSDETQTYFAERTFEYPLVNGVNPHPSVPPLHTGLHDRINLNALGDVEETVQLLRRVGALP